MSVPRSRSTIPDASTAHCRHRPARQCPYRTSRSVLCHVSTGHRVGDSGEPGMYLQHFLHW
eukprot:403988-Rhodomonas_salina.2